MGLVHASLIFQPTGQSLCSNCIKATPIEELTEPHSPSSLSPTSSSTIISSPMPDQHGITALAHLSTDRLCLRLQPLQISTTVPTLGLTRTTCSLIVLNGMIAVKLTLAPCRGIV